MNTIHIYHRTYRLLIFIIIYAALAYICIDYARETLMWIRAGYLHTYDFDELVWTYVVFLLGIMWVVRCVFLLWALFNRRPQISISADGIHFPHLILYHRLPKDKIEWQKNIFFTWEEMDVSLSKPHPFELKNLNWFQRWISGCLSAKCRYIIVRDKTLYPRTPYFAKCWKKNLFWLDVDGDLLLDLIQRMQQVPIHKRARILEKFISK